MARNVLFDPPESYIRSQLARSTRATKALSKLLEETQAAVITEYELFGIIQKLYKSRQKLYLREKQPSIKSFRRLRNQLRTLRILRPDQDYPAHANRILLNSDWAADDICCTVDPFCYVSHLSAMQRFGLSERRPGSLMITVPGPRIGKKLIAEKMTRDHGDDVFSRIEGIVALHLVHHPSRVRRRTLSTFKTEHLGASIAIRGSHTRIATIGQTFVDMLEEPQHCGGMPHVVDVWQEHAQPHLDTIISAVTNCDKAITKIRAGYLLDELMGIADPRVKSWSRFASRGGSRRLDPHKPYAPTHSEKWMLSINA